MTQAAIAGQVHQPLDIDRGLATQIALDRIVAVDRLADLKDFLVRQLVHAAGVFDANLMHDLVRLGLSDAMNVLKRDHYALVRRDVDACNAGHA